ncbi:MAG: gliding motility protein GldN [Fulvivirga sp.]|nr:gliding motility protein GldN [Fulvivirga sp.]
MKLIKIIAVVFVGVFTTPVLGQLSELDQYNPNSIEPIARYEHLFKRRVWVNVDLKEKQNKGFFARGGEITKFIVEAVKSGKLTDIYVNDSLSTKMTKDHFLEKMVYEKGMEVEAWDPNFEYYAGDQVKYNGKVYTAIFDTNANPANTPEDWEETPGVGQDVLFLPQQISILQIMEDRIFDKRRSRLYYKVQSVKLIVPASETLDGVQLPIAVFKYKDLYRLFKEHPGEAIWINRYNSAENKNFADAMTLRLFRGTLFKFENPDDEPIVDMYPGNRMEAVMASEWWEMQLMEKEHNLWEY